jgi:hypothetical protein
MMGSAVLKQADMDLPVKDLIRQIGITEQTFYRWKRQYSAVWNANDKPPIGWSAPVMPTASTFDIVDRAGTSPLIALHGLIGSGACLVPMTRLLTSNLDVVHPFDLAACPRVLHLGQAMLDAIFVADPVEDRKTYLW